MATRRPLVIVGGRTKELPVGDGIDAAFLGGYAIGTSGNTVPLNSGANTWSAQQSFTTSPLLKATSTLEGGEIFFEKPSSSTLVGTHVAVDLAVNGFRVFESGGTNRGFYVDLTACGTQSLLLHDNNFNNYAPTLAGVGAGGTWGIGITGNAGTVTDGMYLAGTQTSGGRKVFSANQAASTSMANAAGGLGGIEMIAAGSAGTAGAAFMSFHRPSSYAAYFGIDTDNKWKVGGWSMGALAYEILHAGNYNTYSPTLTGTGASGSWAINAATVTNGVYTIGDQNIAGAKTFTDPLLVTNAADNIVVSRGLAGYGAFSSDSSGTNNSYMFFRNAAGTIERGRITVQNDDSMIFGTGAAATTRLTLAPTAASFYTNVYISATGATERDLFFATSSINRFYNYINGAGDSFGLAWCDNAGAYAGVVYSVARADGAMTVNGAALSVIGPTYLRQGSTGLAAQIGDDCQIHDINVANAFGIKGVADATAGYIRFGTNTALLGSTGAGNQLTYTGDFSVHGSVTAGNTGTIGMAKLNAGDATHSGYLALFNTTGSVRYMYLGYTDTTTKIVDWTLENGAQLYITSVLPTTISTGATGRTDTLTVRDTGSSGANIMLYGNGAVTPYKYLRSTGGNFEIVNSAYSAVIFTVSDAGALTLASTLNANGINSSQNFISTTGAVVLAATGAGTVYLRPNGAGSATGEFYVNSAGAVTATGAIKSSQNFESTSITAALATSGTGNVYLRPNGAGSITGEFHVGASGMATATGAVRSSERFESTSVDVILATSTVTGIVRFRPNGAGSATGEGYLDYIGNMRCVGEFSSSATNAFRMVQGNYGAFWRNDGGSIYLLSTASLDQYGTFNSYRPFSYNLSNGNVAVNKVTMSLTATEGLSVTDTAASGANFALYGNGATTPNKFIRSISGNLEIVNSAYNAVISSWTDTGNFAARDGSFHRGDTTGVVYLGNAGNRYVYYNGTNYIMPDSPLFVEDTKEVGYKNLVSTTGALTVGKNYKVSAGVTINTGPAADTTYGIYNDSGAAITITQGGGLTLRQRGTGTTGNYTLAQRDLIIIWFVSTTEAVIL